MTTETIVSPDAETQNPAPEAIETPEIVAPETEGQEPQDDKPPQLTEAERKIKLDQRQIDRLTARKYKLTAEVEAMQSRLVEQPRQQTDQFTPDELDAFINTEANKRAGTIAKDQVHSQKMDKVEADLRKSAGAGYQDFYDDLKSAGQAGSVLLGTAMEMDDSSRLLSYFVNDRDALDKCLDMTPIQQAAYMGKLSARLDADKPTRSKAPTPLTPVRGGAVSGEPDINDTARWIKWSNEQDAIKRKR